MAILMRLEVPGGTLEQYDRANEIAGVHGDADAPEGLVSHVCGPTDGGVLIVDVWDSEESFNRFFEERLGAALQEAGVPEARPEILPVHRLIPKGAGAGANVIMMIDFDQGTDVYDVMASNMPSHQGDVSQGPWVSHVAAAKPDGGMVIVDVWESPEAFGAFAQAEIGPSAPEGVGEIQPQLLPVHNRIVGHATAAP